MRILFHYRFLGLGGVETALLNRLGALRAVGMDGTLWFTEFWCDGATYLAGHSDIIVDDIGSVAVANALREHDALVIIDNPTLLFNLAAQGAIPPIIYETHASTGHLTDVYNNVHTADLVRAFVVPSSFNRELLARSGVPSEKVFIVPNCIDTALFRRTRGETLQAIAPE